MQIKKAFITSLPVLAGYLVLGTGFGILMRGAGYGVLWVIAMSVFIFSGTLQYVGVELLAGPAGILQTVITSLVVNARYMFYGVSMIKKYKKSGIYKPYLIFALTDETYSMLSEDTPVQQGENINRYRFFVSFFNHCYWITGGIIGNLLGQVLPFETKGIEFSMTALFVASFTEQWINKKNRIGAAVGLVSTLICLIVFGTEWFLIPAMLIITLVLTLLRKKEAAR